MIIDNCNAWTVRVTFPPGSKDRAGKERRWAHNDVVTVVAPHIDRALEMVKTQYPDATVWAANHIGSRTILMVDMAAATPEPSAEVNPSKVSIDSPTEKK